MTDHREMVRRVEELHAQDQTYDEACRSAGIASASFFRWKRKFDISRDPVVSRAELLSRSETFESRLIRRLNSSQALRVRREIADHCFTAFSSSNQRRLRKSYPELRPLRALVQRTLDAVDRLPPEVRDYLEDLRECSPQKTRFVDIIERLRPFPERLRKFTNALGQHAVETGDAAGGPTSDRRVQRLVVALAYLFVRLTWHRPTHRIDTLTDKPSSPFNRFVQQVIQHFLPKIRIPQTALREVMRHVAARYDWPGTQPKRRKEHRRLR